MPRRLDGRYILAASDTNGNELLQQNIEIPGIGGRFIPRGLFVANNRNIVLTLEIFDQNQT